MPGVGELIEHFWYIEDLGGDPATGLAGNMSTVLKRWDGATLNTASETVTESEIGSGWYLISYTPTLAETYQGISSESSLYQETSFEDVVGEADAANFTGAYCSEDDVCSWTGVNDYSASTKPTETQVAAFAQMRAAEVYGWMREVLGTLTPGPSAYNATIDTSTDAGLALSRVCRLANAIGAAMDAIESASAPEVPRRSERVAELLVLYEAMKSDLMAQAESYLTGSWTATHISEGEITPKSVTAREEDGMTFNGQTEW